MRRWLLLLALLGSLPGATAVQPALGNDFARDRQRMVDDDIVKAGIKNSRVIQSMRDTLRHEFMPLDSRNKAYYDMALAIGSKQTISPPFVVAYMTEQLDPQPTDKVLEIGTGSGYQAAILSPLVKDVYTIEIVKQLGERAARTLKRLKYANVHPRIGDGFQGWPEAAPFDKIIVTCSPEKVPPKLVEQLKDGGRMIVPVGERYQQMLYLFEKKEGKLERVALLPTLFVPMTGAAEAGRQVLPDPEHPEAANGSFEQLVGSVNTPRVAELKADHIVPGSDEFQAATVGIIFYDENRGELSYKYLGPWRDSFDWKQVTETVRVPTKAREAVVRIGLNGATGTLSLDAVRIEASK